MRILNLFVPVFSGRTASLREICFSVCVLYINRSRLRGFLGNPGGIRTQIGDDSNCSLSFNINPLIELLRQTHGLGCGKIQHL